MSNSDEYKEFLCNTLLIKALLQFLPPGDRKRTQEWLTKLQEIQDGMPDAKARNEYTFYLLIKVQNGTFSSPFDRPPGPGKLKPLCRILPDFLYDEVQKQIKTSYCRLHKMLNVNVDNYEMPPLSCEPKIFQDEQPKPHKGVMAICAAFSNYDDDNTSK